MSGTHESTAVTGGGAGAGGQVDGRHLSTFHVEALRLGAATGAERDWSERHLSGCDRCRKMAASWQAARQEFADHVLARTQASARIRAGGTRVAAAPRARVRWFAALALVPAAAGFLAVWRFAGGVDPGPGNRPTSPSREAARAEGDLGVKGGLDFIVAARRGDRVFRADQEPLRAGDQIRFVLDGASAPFVLIGSIDGDGRATVYVPYGGAQSLPLAPVPAEEPRRVELAGSIVLDASPGPERLFALLSERPLAAGPVREALAAVGQVGAASIRDTKTLALPGPVIASAGTLIQRSVLIEKVNP